MNRRARFSFYWWDFVLPMAYEQYSAIRIYSQWRPGMFAAVIQTARFIARKNQWNIWKAATKLPKNWRVQSVSSLAGYEILSEGTGANSNQPWWILKLGGAKTFGPGDHEPNWKKNRKMCRAQQNFSSHPPYRVMVPRWFWIAADG